MGGRLTIADIAVASPFVNSRHAGFAPRAQALARSCARFLDRIHGAPSFKKLIEEESPVFGKRAGLIND